MNRIVSVYIVCILICREVKSQQINKLEPITTSEDRIRAHGYPAESHYVETSDNYVLNIFRIPYSPNLQNENNDRPAVLVFHGLSANSDTWLASGPDNSLAYNLVDAGYDVWLGNARGNIYSRNNTRLSPNSREFWKFSWHEIGTIDVPTVIDYIIDVTGQSAIRYVGYSQGTTIYFVLLSTRPEYNQKIITGQLLAPCAFIANSTSKGSPLFGALLGNPSSIWVYLLSNKEFLPHNTFIIRFVNTICSFEVLESTLCKVLRGIPIVDARKNATAIEDLRETNSAGASMNQLIHYAQLYESDEFRQYDFGVRKNVEIYGSITPLNYNLTQITAQTYLYWGESDELCSPPGVQKLIANFPHLTDDFRINDSNWDHGDFGLNLNIKTVINDPVIEIFNENDGSK